MIKNLLITLILSLFALSFYSCRSNAPARPAANKFNVAPVVEGYVARPGVVEQTVSVSGTLKPFEETVLMPEVAGRVVSINLPEGKSVAQGTLLVKLFDGDLQAGLKKAQAQLDLAQQTEKRLAELIKINGISKSDYDQAVLQVNSIGADLEILRVQIRKTEVRAPFDGMIGLRSISLGAQVAPGTPLATIRAVSRLKLDFSVPEKYSGAVKQGMKVTFHIQESDAKYDASVLATEQGIDAATRNMKVRAVVNNMGSLLRPGAFADVELSLGRDTTALMVPTQAVIPTDRGKLLIVAKAGKAAFVPVETGVRQAAAVQVVKGIAAGDTVVTTGLLFLKPGADLKFSRIATQ